MASPLVPPNMFPPPFPYSQYPPPPQGLCWYPPPPMPPMGIPPYPPPWSHGPPPSRGWRGGNRRRGYTDSQRSGGDMFECKACDKQYKTRESYMTHVQSHVKCSECEFEGAGKALKDHQLMHMIPNELKFTSEEDIRKWREERKRKYPTAENVAKKKQLAVEKKERGESAVTPLYRYIQHLIGEDSTKFSRGGRHGRGHRGGRGKPYNQFGHHRKLTSARRDSKQQELISDPPKNESLSAGHNCDNVDDGSPSQESIMGAILADCDVLATGPPVETTSQLPSEQSSSSSRQNKRGGKWTSRRQYKRARATVGLEAVHRTRKPTLLEKLLAPEICREENVLLQCIRHVTAQKFFEPIEGTSQEM